MSKEDNLDFKNEYLYEVEARGILIKEQIGKEQRVTIPEIIENKKVTKIASEAFEGKNLLEVNMPDTIKEIGKYAFASNMYLEHIKLSSNLKSIPEGMLAFCTKLKNVEIPSSVKSIGKNSLDYVKLRKIIIPSSVQKINNKVFGRKLEKIKSTTFVVEKNSFAEEFLTSKKLEIEYISNL